MPAQLGYPADKPSGTMWLSQCQAVAYDYDGNQGIFKDVSQCTEQVRALCFSDSAPWAIAMESMQVFVGRMHILCDLNAADRHNSQHRHVPLLGL